MGRFTVVLLLIFTAFFTFSCNKCKGEDPRMKILNNGTDEAAIIIKDSEGSTSTIPELEKGSISPLTDYPEGDVHLTYTIEGTTKNETINLKKCYTYSVTIDSDNDLIIFTKSKK